MVNLAHYHCCGKNHHDLTVGYGATVYINGCRNTVFRTELSIIYVNSLANSQADMDFIPLSSVSPQGFAIAQANGTFKISLSPYSPRVTIATFEACTAWPQAIAWLSDCKEGECSLILGFTNGSVESFTFCTVVSSAVLRCMIVL